MRAAAVLVCVVTLAACHALVSLPGERDSDEADQVLSREMFGVRCRMQVQVELAIHVAGECRMKLGVIRLCAFGVCGGIESSLCK